MAFLLSCCFNFIYLVTKIEDYFVLNGPVLPLIERQLTRQDSQKLVHLSHRDFMSHGFDEDSSELLYLLMGALMLPNAVSQAVTLLRKQHAAPMWSFHFSLVMNAGYSCMIYYYFGEGVDEVLKTAGIVLLSIAVLVMILPVDQCCSKKSFQGNHFVFNELFHDFLDAKRFRELVERNRAAPPVVNVNVTASHMENRRVTHRRRDSRGRTYTEHKTNKERVVTWRDTRQFLYASWEEQGNSIRLDDKLSVIHALFYVSYKFDTDAKMALQCYMNQLYVEGRMHDVDVEVNYHCSTPDLVAVACGTLGSERNWIVSFYGSWYGRLAWFLAWILGYQSLFECVWSSTGERMRMRLVKRMSMGHSLRAKCGHSDHMGAEQSFKNGALGPIIGPSNPVNTPYAPPSETILLPGDDSYPLQGPAPECPSPNGGGAAPDSPPLDDGYPPSECQRRPVVSNDDPSMPRLRSRPRNTSDNEPAGRPMVISTDRLWTHMPE